MAERFEHRFEGAEVLDGLLDLAGIGMDSHQVLARFVEAQQAGQSHSATIPTLFDGEPRFGDPEIARRLFQNLLGLWDQIASGKKVVLKPEAHPKREKRVRPTPPEPFGDGGPDATWVEKAWQYLEDLPEGNPRELERLTHAFENRQDDLVQWLDEVGLSDDEYTTARYLLFELFVMLEVGGGQPVPRAKRKLLEAAPDSAEVPQALKAYVEDSVLESELPDPKAVSTAVMKGLRALWSARTGKD